MAFPMISKRDGSMTTRDVRKDERSNCVLTVCSYCKHHTNDQHKKTPQALLAPPPAPLLTDEKGEASLELGLVRDGRRCHRYAPRLYQTAWNSLSRGSHTGKRCARLLSPPPFPTSSQQTTRSERPCRTCASPYLTSDPRRSKCAA